MKKILIITISAVALVGVFVAVMFTLNGKEDVNDQAPPAPEVVQSSVPIQDTLDSILATEPAVLAELESIQGECNAEAGIKAQASTPVEVSLTYEELLATATEVAESDEAIELIEDSSSEEVNGKNINLVYSDGSAILFNITEGEFRATLISTC